MGQTCIALSHQDLSQGKPGAGNSWNSDASALPPHRPQSFGASYGTSSKNAGGKFLGPLTVAIQSLHHVFRSHLSSAKVTLRYLICRSRLPGQELDGLLDICGAQPGLPGGCLSAQWAEDPGQQQQWRSGSCRQQSVVRCMHA